MDSIIIATLVVGIIGLVMGLLLIAVDKKFAVEVDEKEVAVRSFLPGNNCGACGYAGCDAMAAAIVKGEAPVNGCPVGGDDAGNKIGNVMGVSADATDKKVAYVKCSGKCGIANVKANYVGITDCQAAALAGVNHKSCDYGCYGFGSCVSACPFGAIKVIDGVAKIDRKLCKACGKCVATCPRHLIEIVPDRCEYVVKCSNKDKGPAVKKACTTGCIGCGICVKQCENEAIVVEGNVAKIDYEKCIGCGKCAEKCPQKVIKNRESMIFES